LSTDTKKYAVLNASKNFSKSTYDFRLARLPIVRRTQTTEQRLAGIERSISDKSNLFSQSVGFPLWLDLTNQSYLPKYAAWFMPDATRHSRQGLRVRSRISHLIGS
jgi:hypothetical protein